MEAHSLLIIDIKGKLKQLQCPFKVYAVKPMNGLPAYRTVQVDEVLACPLYRLQFVVNGQAYPYEIFRFLDDFNSKFKHSFRSFSTE